MPGFALDLVAARQSYAHDHIVGRDRAIHIGFDGVEIDLLTPWHIRILFAFDCTYQVHKKAPHKGRAFGSE
jgi:hypothetical protein